MEQSLAVSEFAARPCAVHPTDSSVSFEVIRSNLYRLSDFQLLACLAERETVLT